MTTDRWPLLYWRSLAGILATALMLGFYARGGPAWLLGFVALVPWLRVLDARATTRGAVVAGLLMSFAFVASVFLWFGAAIGAFTGIGALPGMALLLVLAPVMQPQLLAFALVRHIVGRSHGPLLRAVAGASAWVACEWLLPKLLGDTLGHGLLPSALLRQSADLGGAAGLTFLLILVNEGIAIALARRREGVRAWLRPIGLATALVAAMSAYGVLRLHSLQAPPADEAPTLRVAMVQASITDYERLRREIGAYGVVRQVLDTHYELSMAALRDHQADVLLWSETVYPTTFGSPRSEDGAALDQEILGLVETLRVPLVFGTYDVDEAGEYNAAAFLEPGRGLIATYRKTHPFPLTEYVPPWLDHAWLRRLLPWAGTWKPGSGARVLPLRSADGREVNVVPLICLDDVRPGLAIDGARLGAQAIVGMSNDSWFTDYPVGARLHLSVAAFRSIETRLPQVRVTTNGLSAIIDDTGAVLATTGMGDQAVLTAYLSARDPAPTLMVRWGDWVGRAGLCLLALLAALAAWRAMRQRQAKADVGPYLARVAVLPPAARLAAGLLRAGAGLGLAWLALDMLLRTGLQVQSLTQLWIFLGAVLAPVVAAGAIGKHFAARAFIADGLLVLDQRTQRIEIPLGSIIAVRDWRLPLPGPGAHLELASGQRWHHGIAMANPAALERALADAGSPLLRQESAGKSIFAEFARTRAAGGRHRLDTALVKFVLFPLLPALVAFRLHQVIAFGGTFGELLTYGFTAWFSGLLIWWASWSLGLMLFAAVLRIVIEVGTLLMIPLGGDRAMAGRDAMTWLARGVYYLGVPAWLAIRLLQA